MNTEVYNRSLPLLASALTDQRGIKVEVGGNKAFTDGYGSTSMSGQLVREILCIPAEGYEERRKNAETFEAECERRGAHPDAVLMAWAVSGGVCGGASYSMANYVSDYMGDDSDNAANNANKNDR